ncbi:hypothetical protein CB1_001024009 [Camelus ferus]|nr:hypothetical protein CB1_001024009 [Camelus ferus]
MKEGLLRPRTGCSGVDHMEDSDERCCGQWAGALARQHRVQVLRNLPSLQALLCLKSLSEGDTGEVSGKSSWKCKELCVKAESWSRGLVIEVASSPASVATLLKILHPSDREEGLEEQQGPQRLVVLDTMVEGDVDVKIVDGNVKMTLGMIWTIILRFAIQDISVEVQGPLRPPHNWQENTTTARSSSSSEGYVGFSKRPPAVSASQQGSGCKGQASLYRATRSKLKCHRQECLSSITAHSPTFWETGRLFCYILTLKPQSCVDVPPS